MCFLRLTRWQIALSYMCLLTGVLGAGSMLVARAQEEIPEDFEVQGRGPLHEAFAQPLAPSPQPGPLVPRQPPEPVPEEPPVERPEGDNVQWIPGYWAWDPERNDFIWVSGVWRQVPPGQTFVAGYWQQVDGGWRWVPGFWAPAAAEQLDYLPVPPASLEQGPVAPPPAEDYIYSPGYWVFREGRYLWRPGCWLRARLGWVWVPPHYVWTPAGCLFVPGYWDYPLEARGLLFAPVVFHRPIWRLAGWSFCPRWAIEPAPLLGCLFLGPQASSYWFGDCFALAGPRGSFTLWIDLGPRYYDPLWTYYRFTCGRDPAWLPGLRQLYLDRLTGRVPRPPRTLLQQNVFVQDTTVINNINRKNIINIDSSRTTISAPAASTPLGQQTLPVLLTPAKQLRTMPLRLTTQSLPSPVLTQTRQRFQEAARIRHQWEQSGHLLPRPPAGTPAAPSTIKPLKLSQVTTTHLPPAGSQRVVVPAPSVKTVPPSPMPRTPPSPSVPASPAPATPGGRQVLPQKNAAPPASPGQVPAPVSPRLPPAGRGLTSQRDSLPLQKIEVQPQKIVKQLPATSSGGEHLSPTLSHRHLPPGSVAMPPRAVPVTPPRPAPLPAQSLHRPAVQAPQPPLRPPSAPHSPPAARNSSSAGFHSSPSHFSPRSSAPSRSASSHADRKR